MKKKPLTGKELKAAHDKTLSQIKEAGVGGILITTNSNCGGTHVGIVNASQFENYYIMQILVGIIGNLEIIDREQTTKLSIVASQLMLKKMKEHGIETDSEIDQLIAEIGLDKS